MSSATPVRAGGKVGAPSLDGEADGRSPGSLAGARLAVARLARESSFVLMADAARQILSARKRVAQPRARLARVREAEAGLRRDEGAIAALN